LRFQPSSRRRRSAKKEEDKGFPHEKRREGSLPTPQTGSPRPVRGEKSKKLLTWREMKKIHQYQSSERNTPQKTMHWTFPSAGAGVRGGFWRDGGFDSPVNREVKARPQLEALIRRNGRKGRIRCRLGRPSPVEAKGSRKKCVKGLMSLKGREH